MDLTRTSRAQFPPAGGVAGSVRREREEMLDRTVTCEKWISDHVDQEETWTLLLWVCSCSAPRCQASKCWHTDVVSKRALLTSCRA